MNKTDGVFSHLMWRDGKRRKAGAYGIFNLWGIERTSAHGRTGEFMLVESPDWVTILPVESRPSDNFLMVRQFRHGSAQVTLEFPAGVVHKGELSEKAAARELLEETGCRAVTLLLLGSVNPNPAFMTNQVHTYLALDVQEVQEPQLDELELLELERVPAPTVFENMGAAPFSNGIMVIALSWYRKWLETVKA